MPATGLLADGAMPDVFVLHGLAVGQTFSMDSTLETNATGTSGAGQAMDATIRVGANFGFRSLTNGVNLVSRMTRNNAPDTSTVNAGHVAAVIPEFPIPVGSSTAPEAGTLVLLSVPGVLLGIAYRRNRVR